MRQQVRDAEHLLRMVGLFVIGTALFLVVRAILVPADFGELGHFRTGAIDDMAAFQPVFAGRQACAECHGEIAAAAAGDRHARVGCESCHGALGAHARQPDVAAAPAALEPVALCASCHAANPSRPAGHPQVEPEEHSEGNACTECHDPHAPSA